MVNGKRWLIYLVPLSFILCVPKILWALGCGELTNGYGPFDYRTITRQQRELVEGAHFTSEVETLAHANTGYLGGDIDYTLRAFPNSPRALLAMSRLGVKQKTEFPGGAKYPIECYFDRAFRIASDDPSPHLIYSIYLKERNRKLEALQQLDLAGGLKKELDSYEFPYNMALGYFDLAVYDKAMDYARKAYDLGAPFPGLRNKLVAAGKWKEVKEEQTGAQASEPVSPKQP